MIKTLRLILLATLTLVGCELLNEGGVPQSFAPSSPLIVGNGGNFADQDGFLSLVDPGTGLVSNGPSLDGFVQALGMHGDQVFALINTFGAGRIDVFLPGETTPTGSITDLISPRDMTALGDRIFVTGFTLDGTGSVTEIDPVAATIVATHPVGSYPEGITAAAGRLFVAEAGFIGAGTTLAVLNPDTGLIEQTIDLGCDGPRDVLPVDGGELFVICLGKTVYNADFTEVMESTNGQGVFVDPSSYVVTARIEFAIQLGSTNGSQSGISVPETGEAYVLAGASDRVYRVDTDRKRIAAEFALPSDGELIGLSGLAYDLDRNLLYAGRLARSGGGAFPDFAASGGVVVISRDGEIQDSWTVGPAPSHLLLPQ